MNFRKSIKWHLKKIRSGNANYLFSIFAAIIIFVILVVIYKIIFSKQTYIYAKIKVGQGFWWASTAKPAVWYVDSIKEGDTAKDFLGRAEATVIEKRYYHFYTSDSFDIYLTLKLKVSYNKNSNSYKFNRSDLTVSSPIDIQFPKTDITGTVIALSSQPPQEKLHDKILYLTKRNAYPWEFDAIHIGDNYFDGKDNILEIIDKSALGTQTLTSDSFGNATPNLTEHSKYITVKVKAKLKRSHGQWVLGEDQLIIPGKNFNLSTPDFVFDNYTVSKIE